MEKFALSPWYFVLLFWSLLALLWWGIVVYLIWRWRSEKHPVQLVQPDVPVDNAKLLTLFKPLPGPLGTDERERLSRCLDSFVAQMDENCEMLIGAHTDDEDYWQAYAMHNQKAEIRVVSHLSPRSLACNPKISWMRLLIPHARGDLWFWCDADIKAPPDALRQLRTEFLSHKMGMLTCSYVIDELAQAPDILDAMFVNLEFYPGVLLLGATGGIAFGFGSGMLFSAARFRKRADLNFLSNSLADDYHLGRMLQPVRLSRVRLATSSQEKNWQAALLHYFRWQKTIRWNRPGGFASQLMILPLIGWLLAVPFLGASHATLIPIAVLLTADTLVGASVMHMIGSRYAKHLLLYVPLWSIIRILTWIACWLPIPVNWRGQKWTAPLQTR